MSDPYPTAFDVPMCPDDVGMGRCPRCRAKVGRLRMKWRRKRRRRTRG